MTRKEFEQFLTAPPYEKNITRFPSDREQYAWAGQYADYDVQLAWEVLQEAKKKGKREG
jgi:hypothetical protein